MAQVEKFGEFSKKLIKEFKGASPLAPIVKPSTKPSVAPTRPPRPSVDPRPKAGGETVPVKPITKPATKPAPMPTRPPRPSVDPRPKAGGEAPVKPVVKPSIKPSISPTRPPRPSVDPRPKALGKLLLRYNYLLRSGALRPQEPVRESIEGKGIPKSALDKIKADFVAPGMGNVMSNGMAAKNLEGKINALESTMDKAELKDIAMELVAKQFPDNGIGMKFSDLKWDVELVSPEQSRNFKVDQDALTRKSKSISIYPDKTKDAIYKKRVMNQLTQGYAVKSQEYFFDPNAEEVVDKLAPSLVENYMAFFKHAQKANQAMPEGKELEDMLRSHPPQPDQLTGMMEIVWEGDDAVIKVRAINLFFLVHEMTKGVYEMMSLHGMQYDPKTTQAMVDESDTLFDEQYGFKYGAGLASLFDEFYNELETALIRSADIHEHSPAAKPALLALMYNQSELNDKQFLNMMEMIFKGKADENTMKKAKALYMRVVQSSLDRAEMEREQDIIDNTDVDGVDISSLFGSDFDQPRGGSSSPAGMDDDDDYPPTASRNSMPSAPEPEAEDEPTMDDVLDKISATGMASLTPKERALLKSMEERRTVRPFSSFLNEEKTRKVGRSERVERRIAFLEKKLSRQNLPVNDRALTEAELIHVKRKR